MLSETAPPAGAGQWQADHPDTEARARTPREAAEVDPDLRQALATIEREFGTVQVLQVLHVDQLDQVSGRAPSVAAGARPANTASTGSTGSTGGRS